MVSLPRWKNELASALSVVLLHSSRSWFSVFDAKWTSLFFETAKPRYLRMRIIIRAYILGVGLASWRRAKGRCMVLAHVTFAIAVVSSKLCQAL